MGLDNPLHIAFLLVIVLFVFGAKRLPEMGRSLGSGLRGFRDSLASEPEAPAVALTAAGAPDGAAAAEPVLASPAPVTSQAGSTSAGAHGLAA